MNDKNCCPEDISKQSPCWDGYVQRGMKPGENGRPVPNCVPVAKADDTNEEQQEADKSLFSNFGKDYTRSHPIDLKF
jgi:hypothetical protein